MSTADVVPIRGSALDRVVAAAKQLEEHEEIDRWEFAGDVAEAVDEHSGENGFRLNSGEGGRHHETGFYAAIDEVNDALTEAGVISVGRASIRGAYTTAKAWPQEDRVEGATYWAHYELRGRDYDGRRKRALERLVARSATHRVGPRDVRLWKSSTKPADLTPFLEKVDHRVRTAIKSAAAPWNSVAEGDRFEIARNLRRLANEIDSGEFT